MYHGGNKPSVAGPVEAGGGLAVCFCMEVSDSLPDTDIPCRSADLAPGCYFIGCGIKMPQEFWWLRLRLAWAAGWTRDDCDCLGSNQERDSCAAVERWEIGKLLRALCCFHARISESEG
jgi:hypothetical protein